MRQIRVLALTIPMVLLLLGVAPAHAGKGDRPGRAFAFDYVATVKDIPAGARRVEVWIPMPRMSELQQVSELEIDAPAAYSLHTGSDGNVFLHLLLESPRTPEVAVRMRFEAARSEYRAVLDGKLMARGPEIDPHAERWLAPERLVPLDDKIRSWAREVVEAAGARTDLEKARAIYNHVVSTVKYDKTGEGWGRGDIYYACDARRGNCTDFHAIFIGYCRAVGIPARFTIGFPVPEDRGEGAIGGYHCWAEFYVPGAGWIPVDASEAAKNPAKREYFFGTIDENRVEFTRGRDLLLTPRQSGAPLNYFVYPYVEIDGKPYAQVDRQFRYRDVNPAPSR